MSRLSTKTAEKIYKILVSKLGVNSDYYDSESFIYQYGVVTSPKDSHHLKSKDGLVRTFYCDSELNMQVVGPGSDLVDPILKSISDQVKSTK